MVAGQLLEEEASFVEPEFDGSARVPGHQVDGSDRCTGGRIEESPVGFSFLGRILCWDGDLDLQYPPFRFAGES